MHVGIKASITLIYEKGCNFYLARGEQTTGERDRCQREHTHANSVFFFQYESNVAYLTQPLPWLSFLFYYVYIFANQKQIDDVNIMLYIPTSAT